MEVCRADPGDSCPMWWPAAPPRDHIQAAEMALFAALTVTRAAPSTPPQGPLSQAARIATGGAADGVCRYLDGVPSDGGAVGAADLLPEKNFPGSATFESGAALIDHMPFSE